MNLLTLILILLIVGAIGGGFGGWYPHPMALAVACCCPTFCRERTAQYRAWRDSLMSRHGYKTQRALYHLLHVTIERGGGRLQCLPSIHVKIDAWDGEGLPANSQVVVAADSSAAAIGAALRLTFSRCLDTFDQEAKRTFFHLPHRVTGKLTAATDRTGQPRPSADGRRHEIWKCLIPQCERQLWPPSTRNSAMRPATVDGRDIELVAPYQSFEHSVELCEVICT
jgi:hypothetical protein